MLLREDHFASKKLKHHISIGDFEVIRITFFSIVQIHHFLLEQLLFMQPYLIDFHKDL